MYVFTGLMFLIFMIGITWIQYRQRTQTIKYNELGEFFYGSKSEKKIYKNQSWKRWYDTIYFHIVEM